MLALDTDTILKLSSTHKPLLPLSVVGKGKDLCSHCRPDSTPQGNASLVFVWGTPLISISITVKILLYCSDTLVPGTDTFWLIRNTNSF